MKLANKTTKVQESDKFKNNNIKKNTIYTMYKIQEHCEGVDKASFNK